MELQTNMDSSKDVIKDNVINELIENFKIIS